MVKDNVSSDFLSLACQKAYLNLYVQPVPKMDLKFDHRNKPKLKQCKLSLLYLLLFSVVHCYKWIPHKYLQAIYKVSCPKILCYIQTALSLPLCPLKWAILCEFIQKFLILHSSGDIFVFTLFFHQYCLFLFFLFSPCFKVSFLHSAAVESIELFPHQFDRDEWFWFISQTSKF